MIFYTLRTNDAQVLNIGSTNRAEIDAYTKEYQDCDVEVIVYREIDFESSLLDIAHWEIPLSDPSSYQLVLDKKYRNIGIRNILAGITKDESGFSYYTTPLGQFNLFIHEDYSKHKNYQAGYLHNTELTAVLKYVEDLIINNLKTLRMQADSLLLKIEEAASQN